MERVACLDRQLPQTLDHNPPNTARMPLDKDRFGPHRVADLPAADLRAAGRLVVSVVSIPLPHTVSRTHYSHHKRGLHKLFSRTAEVHPRNLACTLQREMDY